MLFSRNSRPDYESLLKDISNIELSNENVDSKTTADKVYLLKLLKDKIEHSGILDPRNSSNEVAHGLIRSVYGLLYNKQGDFPKSYYFTLVDSLAHAHSYNEMIRPYEQFLAQKMVELKTLAQESGQNADQKRMSSALGNKAGILKTAMIALMIGIMSSCSIGQNKGYTFPMKDSSGKVGEYHLRQDDAEKYVLKQGRHIDNPEMGHLISKMPTVIKYTGGQTETGYVLLYNYNTQSDKPDIIVLTKSNGKILTFYMIKGSERYDLVKRRFSDKLFRVENGR